MLNAAILVLIKVYSLGTFKLKVKQFSVKPNANKNDGAFLGKPAVEAYSAFKTVVIIHNGSFYLSVCELSCKL